MKALTVFALILLSLLFTYPSECSTVALWLLDDDLIPEEELPEGEVPETIVHDLSGSEIIGSITGAKFVKGKYNSALKFDGQDDVVDFGVPAALEAIADQITLEAWVNVPEEPQKGTTQTIFGQFLGVAELQFSMDDGKLRGKVTTKLTMGVGDPDPFPANEWVHVALTYDGAALKLYRNGVVVASKAVNGKLSHTMGQPTSHKYRLGASSVEGQWHFKGLIDEVRISDVALPAEQLGFFKRFSQEGIMHIVPVEERAVEAAGKLASTWADIKKSH